MHCISKYDPFASAAEQLITLKCGGLGGSLVDGGVDGEHYVTLYFYL